MLHFERSAKNAVKFRFGHGRYIDPWLLTHIIWGILIGLIGLIFNLSFWQILTLSLFFGFIYEVWESIVRIVEDIENSLIDIIGVGVGTFLAYRFFDFRLVFIQLVLLFLGFAALNLLLVYIGWRIYLKRRTNEKMPTASRQQLNDGIGRPKLFRDNVFFFGAAAAILPAPFLFHFNLKMALIWPVFVFLAGVCLIYKKREIK
mgnify:CR=1 FL=1